jgi:hypothetical protein
VLIPGVNWMKKKVLSPLRDEKGSLEKILDKVRTEEVCFTKKSILHFSY